MGKETGISWTHHTFNPIRGCTKISPGCQFCYAETLSKRNPKTLGVWGDRGTRVVASEAMWREPLKWDREAREAGERRRVFCASLADVFEDWRGPMVDSQGAVIEGLTMEVVRDRLFALMTLTTNLDWLTLTKRPEIMGRYISDPTTTGRVAKAADGILVSEAARSIPERIESWPGFPGYFVSNHGYFLTANGATVCLQCGKPLSGDPRAKFCGNQCKAIDYYQRKRGKKERGEVESRLTRMSPDVSEQGHERVMLYRGTVGHRVSVHRAVLSLFDRLPLADDWQGCHRDGNPRNNHIANLRWGSQSENWDDRKRHGNGRSYSKLIPQQVKDMRHLSRHGHTVGKLAEAYKVTETQVLNILAGRQWAEPDPTAWPPPNWWAGVSVEDQETADARIPVLLQIPAAVRFLSMEPLIGPVDLRRLLYRGEFWDAIDQDHVGPSLDWVICGGESGGKARPFELDWARSLRDQCKSAGTAFFLKQLGAVPIGFEGEAAVIGLRQQPFGNGSWKRLMDSHGGDESEWPDDLKGCRAFPTPGASS